MVLMRILIGAIGICYHIVFPVRKHNYIIYEFQTFTKNRNYEFSQINTKIVIMFFYEIQMMKYVCKRPRKISDPDSVEVKIFNKSTTSLGFEVPVPTP